MSHQEIYSVAENAISTVWLGSASLSGTGYVQFKNSSALGLLDMRKWQEFGLYLVITSASSVVGGFGVQILVADADQAVTFSGTLAMNGTMSNPVTTTSTSNGRYNLGNYGGPCQDVLAFQGNILTSGTATANLYAKRKRIIGGY